MQDKKVESIKEVDLSQLDMPCISIYKYPADYPDNIVARVYDIDKPTDIVIVRNTLEEIEKDIRENTEMVFVPRGAEDVAPLVGVWM